MAAFGWLVTPISWGLIGFIWLYNLVWLVVIDLLIAIYRQFDKQEMGHSDVGDLVSPTRSTRRAARQISYGSIVGGKPLAACIMPAAASMLEVSAFNSAPMLSSSAGT